MRGPTSRHGSSIPDIGPNRDHWSYFLRSRVTPSVLAELLNLQRDLATERASEVGLLDPCGSYSVGAYQRDHVVGIDGKVFSSPLRPSDQERRRPEDGALRPVRQTPHGSDTAKAASRDSSGGTKFAIASVRSPMANHRVVLGIEHFSSTSSGGRGTGLHLPGTGSFSPQPRNTCLHRRRSLARKAPRSGPERHGMRCHHPCPPPEPRNGRHPHRGRYSFAAQPLPWSARRQKREAACGGHQLWASAGTISNRSSWPTDPASS